MTKRLSRCIHCGHGFPDRDELERHLKDLHMGAPNKEARCCISCGKVTAELEQHMQDKHIGPPKLFQCRAMRWRHQKNKDPRLVECKKEWRTAGDRNKHEFTHTLEECETAGLVRLQ